MDALLAAVGILAGSGFLCLLTARRHRLCSILGAGGAVTGSVVGLIPAMQVLAGGPTESVYYPWQVPYGAFAVELDPLSAFFIVPILVLTGLSAIYGSEYLEAYRGKRQLGSSWFCYHLLTASMILVVLARNGVFFLAAWEVMTLASFFLVTFEDDREMVRQAGWTYLVAAHLGTAFLLALFILLGGQGGLDFAGFFRDRPAGQTNLLFLLAMIGFGTKAGFLPLHVWLPEAHPAAPSHVSAVLSGVMVKTGIYGLVRTLTFLGPPAEWWGWLLIAVGLSSGVLGILFTLAQRDLKRLLAYSTVENVGIIALGLGLGLLGRSHDLPGVAVLGFAGALLHVLNHALCKGTLFLAAGSVLHGTHTANIEELGGLLRRMPATGTAFLMAAAALAGLPPLSAFVSEFLIYLCAFREQVTLTGVVVFLPAAAIAGLALMGGLAAAAYARAFGIGFLGEPRSEHAALAHGPGPRMRWPMLLLAAGGVLAGLLAPLFLPFLSPVVESVSGVPSDQVKASLHEATSILLGIVAVSAGLAALIVGLACLRGGLLRGREVGSTGTWDCGYARPTPRMQYTASSFAQPLTEMFRPLLGTKESRPALPDYFPQAAALATECPEPWRERAYRPLFTAVGWFANQARWLQHGRVQLYVLYIALTILCLLVWYLGRNQ